MDLSVVIVNWNSAEYVIPCVSSIHAQTKNLEFEVIVVDNASVDDSCRVIQERCPSVKLVRSPRNIGFARANNLGFQHCSGRILLFLNPDTELHGPAINLMHASLDSSSEIGVLGCRLLNPDLTLQTSCVHLLPTILNQAADNEHLRQLSPRLKFWGMRPLFHPDSEKPVAVEGVSGACQMIKREVFEKVGLFSTDYFMYMEDLDLCWKVRGIGKKVCYLHAATIVHHGGQSSRKRGAEDFSGPMQRESLLIFLRKSRGSFYAGLYRTSVFLVSLLRIAILVVLIPLRSARVDRHSLQASLNKWYKILRWSMGLEPWTRQQADFATAALKS